MDLLNKEEVNELERCEVVIRQGLQTFIEVGQALLTIRDKRLYRSEFKTFEEYCNERWSMSKRHIDRMIGASQVISNLGPQGPILPKNEKEARPLTKLEPEVQIEAWSEVVAQHGQDITAPKVQAIADQFSEVNGQIKQAKKEPLFTADSPEELLRKAKEVKRIMNEEKIEAIKSNRKFLRDTLEKKQIEIGTKKYRIVYADPPWSYQNEMPEYVTTPDDYYALMPTDDIAKMPVADITEENAVLFMWTTSPHLPEALHVVKSWGFKYKTTFIWDKVKHNMGHYNSVRHEILLVCTKGACTPDVKKLFDSVVSIERTEHSKKPEEFRRIIETLYVYGDKIELFARESPEGWDVFGNQIN